MQTRNTKAFSLYHFVYSVSHKKSGNINNSRDESRSSTLLHENLQLRQERADTLLLALQKHTVNILQCHDEAAQVLLTEGTVQNRVAREFGETGSG